VLKYKTNKIVHPLDIMSRIRMFIYALKTNKYITMYLCTKIYPNMDETILKYALKNIATNCVTK